MALAETGTIRPSEASEVWSLSLVMGMHLKRFLPPGSRFSYVQCGSVASLSRETSCGHPALSEVFSLVIRG